MSGVNTIPAGHKSNSIGSNPAVEMPSHSQPHKSVATSPPIKDNLASAGSKRSLPSNILIGLCKIVNGISKGISSFFKWLFCCNNNKVLNPSKINFLDPGSIQIELNMALDSKFISDQCSRFILVTDRDGKESRKIVDSKTDLKEIVLDQTKNCHSIKVNIFGIDPPKIHASCFKLTKLSSEFGIKVSSWREYFDLSVSMEQAKDDQYLLESLLPSLNPNNWIRS